LKVGKQTPLERYLSILETIAASSSELIAADIAGHSGLPVATTHRMLQTMRRAGLVDMKKVVPKVSASASVC
jgi:DNA-binding IclR family transcriptional regulator